MAKKRTARKAADPPPWKGSAPADASHTTLTPRAKARAKSAAKKAGRPYPNLVDNMHAAAAQQQARPKPKRTKP